MNPSTNLKPLRSKLKLEQGWSLVWSPANLAWVVSYNGKLKRIFNERLDAFEYLAEKGAMR